ncbi:MAG: hypothetical protein SGI86_10385 [Deltaproteobacteria bacterium]|mgnify:CR=1 FL=1|nr:hypothetical protein [Deltaproteobacteria bacterium]
MNRHIKKFALGYSMFWIWILAIPPAFAENDAAPAKRKTNSSSAKKSSVGTQVKMEDGSKVRAYSFGALDLEGKLKTPQLLYFLNRVRVELDSTAEHRRSFIKELKATADEKGL